MSNHFFGEPKKPVSLEFPSTVGTKWGGVLNQDCIPFDFTGWTGSAILDTDTGPVTLTVDIDASEHTIFFTVLTATALANKNKSCSFVLQLTSGILGFIVSRGTIFFTDLPS